MKEDKNSLDLFIQELANSPKLDYNVQLNMLAEMNKYDKEDSNYIDIRNQLTIANIGLVIGIAKNYLNKGLDLEDLIQEGSDGLMHAIELFDITKDVKLSSYAFYWINRSMITAIHRNKSSMHVPDYIYTLISKVFKAEYEIFSETGTSRNEISDEDIADYLHESLEVIQDVRDIINRKDLIINDSVELSSLIDSNLNPDAATMLDNRAKVILKVINRLPSDDYKNIIKMRFGLDGYSRMSIDEIYSQYKKTGRSNISKAKIRIIEHEALKLLRTEEYSKELKDL